MTLPKAIDAYKDCEGYFEKALAAPNGIAVTLASPTEVITFILKMNTYREKLRKQNAQVYPPEHPQYARSIYDALKVSKDKDNPLKARIEPYRTNVTAVEEL